MNELEVIRYLIGFIICACDCDFDNKDFEALRWLYKQYDYALCAEDDSNE